MTTQQQLSHIINILEDHTLRFDRLEARMDGIEARMDKIEVEFHDFKEETKLMFIGVGEAYIKLSAKIDDIMDQIKEIPLLRKDVNRLEHESADMKLSIFDLNTQYRKMDQKLDNIIEKVNLIAANKYA